MTKAKSKVNELSLVELTKKLAINMLFFIVLLVFSLLCIAGIVLGLNYIRGMI